MRNLRKHKLHWKRNSSVWSVSVKSVHRSRKLLTRNSSGDEIANVNFLYDDISYTRTTTYNRLVPVNSATDGRGYVLERKS